MIYCPQCGTPNKPNSKFCKNCAALLQPSAELRCPICGELNPQTAEACKSCGTRLTTSAGAGASEQTKPANAPEHIAPFNPPEIPPEPEPPTTPVNTRAAFSGSGSQWLRRINKTPAESKPAEPPPTPPANETPIPAEPAPPVSKPIPAETTPPLDDWLGQLDAPVETPKSAEPAPAKPQLSEIKLTGDDYDYSDIGGEVTDEMKAQLEAEAGGAQSVDDEVALAMRLLGLDVGAAVTQAETPIIAETPAPIEPAAQITDAAPVLSEPAAEMKPPAPVDKVAAPTAEIAALPISEPVVEAETAPPERLSPIAASTSAAETPPAEPAPAPAKPQLSEIKLTGDDYDYSDIGGEVTDEMKAQLEAEAGGAQSVDDEVALAMRLLGLDVGAAVTSTTAQAESSAPPPTPLAEPAAQAPQEPSAEPVASAFVEPRAEIETPASEAAALSAQAAPKDQENAEWLTRLAAASSTAVAAKIVSEARDTSETPEPIAEIPTEPIAEIPTEPIAEIPAEPIAEIPTEPIAEIPTEPIAEIPTEPIAEIPTEPIAEIPTEPIAEIPTEPIASEQVAAAAALSNADNIPEWLRAIAPSESADDAASAEKEMPEWVRDLAPGAAVVGTTAFLNQLPDLDESERGDLPEWLREPVEAPEIQAETEFAAEAESGAATAEPASGASVELPAWMRAGAAGEYDPFEVVETTGPLAGVSGILPLAVALTEPHTLATPTPPRADSGRIFQTLLAEPLAAASSVQEAAPPARRIAAKHIVYLVIALAALIGLFLPSGADELGLLGKNVVSSPSAVFYDQLNELPAASAVLLAFDYVPGQSPELEPAARAILENLAARKVNVIALSSNPNGANLAQTLLEQTQRQYPALTFVNLGYIPGNEAGLKNLALGWLPANYAVANGTTWSQTPLAKTVRGMDDLALNILILGDAAGLNGWMTQVQPIVKTPFVAATTAALDPQARIYVNSKQLNASLRGLTGAAELELWSGVSGPAVKTVNALSFVSLVLAGIIIATNLAGFLKRGKREAGK